MSRPPIPTYPTHAIKFKDNWDGEGDICYEFVFLFDGAFYYHENGRLLMQHAGDEILSSWPLPTQKVPQDITWLDSNGNAVMSVTYGKQKGE